MSSRPPPAGDLLRKAPREFPRHRRGGRSQGDDRLLQRRSPEHARLHVGRGPGSARDAALSRPRRGAQGDGGHAHGARRPPRSAQERRDGLRRQERRSHSGLDLGLDHPRRRRLGRSARSASRRTCATSAGATSSRTLGEIAIGVAHEINNPLEVILNNLNLLETHIAKVTPDEDFIVESERLESIHCALDRIQQIVAQLGEMSRGTEYLTREYLAGAQMTDLSAKRDPLAAAAEIGTDPALTGSSHPGRRRRPGRLLLAARSPHARGLSDQRRHRRA